MDNQQYALELLSNGMKGCMDTKSRSKMIKVGGKATSRPHKMLSMHVLHGALVVPQH
jgi:hypothetical protein